MTSNGHGRGARNSMYMYTYTQRLVLALVLHGFDHSTETMAPSRDLSILIVPVVESGKETVSGSANDSILNAWMKAHWVAQVRKRERGRRDRERERARQRESIQWTCKRTRQRQRARERAYNEHL